PRLPPLRGWTLPLCHAGWRCALIAACCDVWSRTSSPMPSNIRQEGVCLSAAGGAATFCVSTFTTPPSAFRNLAGETYLVNSIALLRAQRLRADWDLACQ